MKKKKKKKKKKGEKKGKKKFQSALFSPLGRWTENNFLFKGGLMRRWATNRGSNTFCASPSPQDRVKLAPSVWLKPKQPVLKPPETFYATPPSTWLNLFRTLFVGVKLDFVLSSPIYGGFLPDLANIPTPCLP